MSGNGNVGISAYLADKWLGELGQSGVWMQAFIGVPGADGTANLAAETTRAFATFARSSSGLWVITGLPPIFQITTGETLSHLGAFDGSDAGANFLFSAQAVASKLVANGDQVAVGAFTLKFPNLATD
ncbi:phage tail fiber protein [Mycobacterium palustre]|uniref:Uncharacterized protein n=1 Tax=Mycobacterium palustre TaxID=153971 RepID=A0A1X1ZKX8_9MYCO|nr:hypothetical protein [Mycobacterium palustre]MCV7100969.1 hypothetical protein [Mycobacterium palustre]ORW24010.1 hypothetical protein AWC19_00185 [Mycobacterium palustre]